LAQFHDPGLDHVLPVKRRSEFGVLTQIAEFKRALDLLWQMDAQF
jgi:hypothetical protein